MSSRYDRDDDRYAGRREYDFERGRYGRENYYNVGGGYGDFRQRSMGAGIRPNVDDYGYSSDRDYGEREYGREGISDRRDYGDYGYGREGASRTGGRGYGRLAGREAYRGRYDRDYSRGYGSEYDRGYGYSGSRYDRDYGTSGRGDYGREYDQGHDYDRERAYRDYGEERGFFDRAADEVRSWFGDEEAERRRRMDQTRGGEYRGRGPRNYRRSDERIREDVNDRLTDHDFLDASDIEVSVSNGEVTLTGTVNNRYAKRLAEEIAESVSGVTNVENRLRVSRESLWSYDQQRSATAGTASTTSTPSTASPTGATGSTSTTGSAARNKSA